MEAAAFVRSRDPVLFSAIKTPPALEDSTSGPGAPDLEFLISPIAWAEHGRGKVPNGYLYMLHVGLLRQVSPQTGRNFELTWNFVDLPAWGPSP